MLTSHAHLLVPSCWEMASRMMYFILFEETKVRLMLLSFSSFSFMSSMKVGAPLDFVQASEAFPDYGDFQRALKVTLQGQQITLLRTRC